jgi:replicative DNA helicase
MTPPSSPEAEQAIIGALLADPSLAPRVITTGLLGEDFMLPANRLLFETIVERFYADEAVDPILVAEALGRRLDAAYGAEHAQTMKWVQGLAVGRQGADAAAHAQLVREQSARRKLLALSAAIEQRATAGELTPEEVAGMASQEAMLIATGNTSIDETETFADVGRAFIREVRQVKAAREAGVELGAYFGIPAFDNYIRGLKGGELMIFAGAPGEGKSGVIWNATKGFAQGQLARPEDRRIAALILSFEMGRYPSSTRVAQMLTGIPGEELREGTLSDEDIRRLIVEWRNRKDLPLLFNFSPSLRCSQIQAVVSEAVRKHNVGLVVIDHFRYFDLDRRLPNRNDEDDEKVRFLKTLARTLNVAVICLAHTRKKGNDVRDPRPKLSDLRGSGQISADSDFVVFLHRPYKYASEEEAFGQGIGKTDAELIYEKNRHAFDGTAKFLFDPERMSVV